MTLSSIARKNIQLNLRQYLIYLNSMVFSVAIYFTFVSLKYNEQLLTSTVTLGKLGPAFEVASIILIIFSAIFIWYSNSFFTRRRKKEVGLYALFGMSRKKIGLLLFFENIIIGVTALIIGIMGGLIFSKLFMMIMFSFMGFTLEVAFAISSQALIQTSVVFLFIIIITSIHSYTLIYRFTLSELFKADRKGENTAESSGFMGVFSIACLGIAYMLLLNPNGVVKSDGLRLLMVMFLLVVGSYLLMKFLIVYLLKLIQGMPSVYFKGKNLLSITHFLYRIKGNVLILTVISLLSSVTLIACITTYSFYYYLDHFTKRDQPYSFMFNLKDNNVNKQVQSILEKKLSNQILYKEKLEYLSIKLDVSTLQRVPDFFQSILLPEKTYKNLMKHRDINDAVHLNKMEAVAFYDGNLDSRSDPYTGKMISFDNKNIMLTSYKKFSLLNQGEMLFPLIISDALYEELQKETTPQTLYIYKTTNEKALKEVEDEINKKIKTLVNLEDEPIYASFYQKYHYGLETYGLLIFIGGFLGLVFLLATGSMIYFKQLIEATTDKERYHILKRIGIPEKEIKKSIDRQVGFVFVLPFLLAAINTVVVIYVIADFLQIQMIVPFFTCMGVYLFIYLAYYWLTTTNYMKTIEKI